MESIVQNGQFYCLFPQVLGKFYPGVEFGIFNSLLFPPLLEFAISFLHNFHLNHSNHKNHSSDFLILLIRICHPWVNNEGVQKEPLMKIKFR